MISPRSNSILKTAGISLLFSFSLGISSPSAQTQSTTTEESQPLSRGEISDTPQAIADSSYAEAKVEDWLQRLSSAHRQLNYQISFVLLKNGVESQPYLWRHAKLSDALEMEQLNLLNGPGREVLRVNNQVSFFESNIAPYSIKADVINDPIPGRLLYSPLSLTDSYDYVMVGRGRISGRVAQQIRVVSRDKSRFGYNLWLDMETGLLLKMNMADTNGQLLEQLQVTELEVTEKPDPLFANIDLDSLPDVINITSNQRHNVSWQLTNMPVGMKVVHQDFHRLPLTGELVSYSMLSDGLVDVSVYIQPQDQAIDGEVLLRHESNTLLTRPLGAYQVTVVGKLPAKTANLIAASVVLNNPGG